MHFICNTASMSGYFTIVSVSHWFNANFLWHKVDTICTESVKKAQFNEHTPGKFQI